MTRFSDVPMMDRLVSRSTILAGAALALPLAAQAGVIVGSPNVTKTSDSGSGDQTYLLDMDGDGTTDFTFTASFTNLNVTVTPGSTYGMNGYIGTSGKSVIPNKATPLTAGTPIDSTGTYLTVPGDIQKSKSIKKEGNKQKGPWPANNAFAYLGVEFYDSSSMLHYGWVDLSASTPDDDVTLLAGSVSASASSVSTFTISQFGYQSDPNTPILAGDTGAVPEPSSLALFAAGAAGIAALRARRKRAS